MEENKTTDTILTPPPYHPQASAQPAEPPKCVNKGKPVYFSYARNSDQQPEWNHIADCVEQLAEVLKAQNIEYLVNNTSETSPDISDYEKNIGWKSDVIVLVFSDRYFRSLHCMYEFVQIKKAIKQFPQKRLFCIKSGNFNLSDINYILDLEHFWGDQKQEYDEVSYHKTRPITNAEEEAHNNGFYMDDIRSLYSFFSTLNYANAHSQDWNDFAKEIADSYTSVSKFSQLVQEKVKQRKTKLKFMGLGCLTWLLMPIIALAAIMVYLLLGFEHINNPVYPQKIDHIEIYSITQTTQGISLKIRLTNPYDKDTIIYASRGWYIEANGKQNHLRLTQDIPMYPEYKVLAAHQSTEYILTFDKIPVPPGSMTLVMSHGISINGIKFIERYIPTTQ